MRRLLVLLAIAVAVVAGCAAAPIAGEARPAGEGTGLPARPRELPLDDVDPCSLLTPAQRAELGLDGEPLPGTTDAPVFAGRTCSITGYEPREVAVSITLATGNGIGALAAPDAVRDALTPTTVTGYPGFTARSTLAEVCAVDVDVAEGQFLDVQFRYAGGGPAIPQDQLCTDAARTAAAVMTTLQSA